MHRLIGRTLVLVSSFGSESAVVKSTLAKQLEEQVGIGYSMLTRAITPGGFGYLAQYLVSAAEACIKLRPRE